MSETSVPDSGAELRERMELAERLEARTVSVLPPDWQKGRKCPECGSNAKRPKCLWEMGGHCPRHDPDNYDPSPYQEVPDKDCVRAAALLRSTPADSGEPPCMNCPCCAEFAARCRQMPGSCFCGCHRSVALDSSEPRNDDALRRALVRCLDQLVAYEERGWLGDAWRTRVGLREDIASARVALATPSPVQEQGHAE
jgi:hypothetical protein